MDSESFPLIDLYCEDEVAKKIILKAINKLETNTNFHNLQELINIIVSGSHSKTHNFFMAHKETYNHKKIRSGYVCILDGDTRNQYPIDDNLFFLYSNESPELFLTKKYLENFPNTTLEYHINNSDNHCLFDKMNELGIGSTKDDAFESCWKEFEKSNEGTAFITELADFLDSMLQKFSEKH